MNQLTTVAALPSGSGCAAALRAEVGEARKPATDEFAPGRRIIWSSDLRRCDFDGPFYVYDLGGAPKP